jgi:hypothetical protein
MESAKTDGPQQQGAALMQRTTKYVALDVHQATTVAAVLAASGARDRPDHPAMEELALVECNVALSRSKTGRRSVGSAEGLVGIWREQVKK